MRRGRKAADLIREDGRAAEGNIFGMFGFFYGGPGGAGKRRCTMLGLSGPELFVVITLFVPLVLLTIGIGVLAVYTTYLALHDSAVKFFEVIHLRHRKAH